MPYILKDKDFESKYGLKVEDVVLKACANPRELLKGFDVYLTPHVQPKVEDLSAIIMAAGGKVSMFLIINFSIIVWHQSLLTWNWLVNVFYTGCAKSRKSAKPFTHFCFNMWGGYVRSFGSNNNGDANVYQRLVHVLHYETRIWLHSSTIHRILITERVPCFTCYQMYFPVNIIRPAFYNGIHLTLYLN